MHSVFKNMVFPYEMRVFEDFYCISQYHLYFRCTYFYVDECFAWVYACVCMYHAFAMPTEARRGPGTGFTDGCEP